MNWYEQVITHTQDNLTDFISHFFPGSNQLETHNRVELNPSPCCGHNGCFSFSKDKPVAYCFSCGTKGNRIQIVEQVWGKENGLDELGKWSGIPFGNRKFETDEEKNRRANSERLQKIYNLAVTFYHSQLFSENPLAEEALAKQIGGDVAKGQRLHSEESLRDFQVGLSLENFSKFNDLMRHHGYTDLELDEAKKMIYIPPFNYVYPYYDQSGNLIRFNTKPFMRRCLGKPKAEGGYTYDCNHISQDTSKKAKREHEVKTGHVMSPDGFSTGDKDHAYYVEPNFKRKKFAVLVEGENDVITVAEELKILGENFERDFLPVGIGGGIQEGFFESPFFRQFKKIYEIFDNDETGDKYREQLAKEIPDVPTYHVTVDKDFDDIDNYLKAPMNRAPLSEMIEMARVVESRYVRIEKEKSDEHIWHARNHAYELIFEVERYNFSKKQLEGKLETKKQGIHDKDWYNASLSSVKIEAGMELAKYELSEHINEYYNTVPYENNEPKRSFLDLLDIIKYTKSQDKVIRQIAWYLHKTDNHKEYNRRYTVLLSKVKSQKLVAEVLKEVNGFTNQDIDPHGIFPKIQLSQYFNVTNDDAFFYFSRVIKDGDTPKLVPCLISNKKEEIRLDLLKRKDPQCFLLIQNKYEVPFEVETAVMDPTDVSLQSHWVEKWKNDELDPQDIEPAVIIKEIEDFIRKCYYLDESTLKVLSLWIYSTYFYMLFKSGFPYLMFTGPKGTGKSTLDIIVSLLALNSKLSIDISESALFRSITFEGGTFIMDEVENLTDKRTVDSNGYATILKGGYSDTGHVFRTNMDKGGSTDKFSVFGPKVISNINGIEDVIGDRCIFIRTFRVGEDKLRLLEDVQLYKEERRASVHSTTSRAALSALTHYRKVYDLFHNVNANIGTGNARLTQLLRPLVAMAQFVGGDYEKHLMQFYQTDVKDSKEEISSGTVEGMLRILLNQIAEEHLGIRREKWATTPGDHLYAKQITYSHATQMFEVDTMHLKVLCEEMNHGLQVDIKTINATMKAILGSSFNKNLHRVQTTATLVSENLQRAMGNARQVRVYKYTLSVRDFVKPEKMEIVNYAEEKPLF